MSPAARKVSAQVLLVATCLLLIAATLIHRGHLLNRPYTSVDQPGPESRPVVTALLFDPLPAA